MSTFSNLSKNSSTFTNPSKSQQVSASYSILLENGFKMLLEDGSSFLLLESSGTGGGNILWSSISKNSSTMSNLSKS